MRYNADGTPDATFGDGGRVRFSYSTGPASLIRAMLIQPDGRIVVGGGDGDRFAVARLLPSGLLDPSFGSGGTVITQVREYPLSGGGNVTSIALEPDGAVVVAGRTASGSSSSVTNTFVVARYDSAGRLDPSFATRGWKEYQVGGLGYTLYTTDPVKAAIAVLR